MDNKFFPAISDLISIDDIPSSIGLPIETNVDSLLDNIVVRLNLKSD